MFGFGCVLLLCLGVVWFAFGFGFGFMHCVDCVGLMWVWFLGNGMHRMFGVCIICLLCFVMFSYLLVFGLLCYVLFRVVSCFICMFCFMVVVAVVGWVCDVRFLFASLVFVGFGELGLLWICLLFAAWCFVFEFVGCVCLI